MRKLSERMKMEWFSKKINIPILILSMAILSLSFNAIQAQVSEENRTTRQAAFEMLKTLNHLQFIVDKEHYGKQNKERYLDGWSDVMLINDLSIFTPITVQEDSKILFDLWSKDFQQLNKEHINKYLSEAIKKTRQSLKTAIKALD